MMLAWRQALETAAEELARFERRKRRPLSVTPEFYDLEYEDLTLVADDGVELAAWFVRPAAMAGRGELMALLHHHYGGQRATLLPWLELLCRLGIACLAFDARGHAGSPCESRQGSYRGRFADLRAAHDELCRRGARRVLAYAQSQAGSLVAGALSDRPTLAGLILDSGPAALASLSIWGLARGFALADFPARQLATARIGFELVRTIRPDGYARAFWLGMWRLRDRPLLWLHGSEDHTIPPWWVGLWFDSLCPLAPSWEKLQVPGAGHVECLQHGGERVERRVAQFVERCASR